MAKKIITCAAPDPRARIHWTDLLLTIFDAFVCADALVLVRFHAMAHPLDCARDNNAIVRGVCVFVLPTV